MVDRLWSGLSSLTAARSCFCLKSPLLTSSRIAFFLYTVFFLLLIAPYWGAGDVIAPHCQYGELGLADRGVQLRENRKFSDFSNCFIPEIKAHLQGVISGKFAMWSDLNELGRPLSHLSGFSPVYLPSWILAHFVSDPWKFITVLSLSTCFITGCFVLFFCQELGLHPIAGLVAGMSLSCSPLFMYWLTFPMFLSVWCWSFGALLGSVCLFRKPSWGGWVLVTFSGYSLLLTAYPQPVVFNAYLLSCYVLFLAYRKCKKCGLKEAGLFLALPVSALLVSVSLVLPVYLDLLHTTAESARTAPDPSFFTAVLPRFSSFVDVIRFFVLCTVPEIFGNPISSHFPFPYDGISVTLLVIFFSVFCFIVSFKRTWGLWLSVVIFFFFACSHSLYLFGVKYLLFSLSRSNPLASLALPLTIIVAFGADRFMRRSEDGELSVPVVIASASVLAVMCIGICVGFEQSLMMHWGQVLVMTSIVALLLVQSRKVRPALLIAVLLLLLVSSSYPLMLHQQPALIAKTSPLVKMMKKNMPAGSRFAIAKPGLSVLPPNFNATVGLASVHSYNSLSSRRYHRLIKALGGVVQTYGRWNSVIVPDYSSPMFWMSNISLVLSSHKLKQENLEYLGTESGVNLYKVVTRMDSSLQVVGPSVSSVSNTVNIADPRLLLTYFPEKTKDHNDYYCDDDEFLVVPIRSPSVFVLSQKFHRDWYAEVLTTRGWSSAKMVAVNGVFQGVILPQNTRRVRLSFKPYVRFYWIGHLFWLCLFFFLACKVLSKRKCRLRFSRSLVG